MRKLQEINKRFVFNSQETNISHKVDIILHIDEFINDTLGVYQSSITAQDFDSIANKLIDAGKVIEVTNLVKLHLQRYPIDNLYRQNVIKKLITRNQDIENLIKKLFLCLRYTKSYLEINIQ